MKSIHCCSWNFLVFCEVSASGTYLRSPLSHPTAQRGERPHLLNLLFRFQKPKETNRPQAVRTHNGWCNCKSSTLPLQAAPALDLKLYCRTFRLRSAAMSHNHRHLYSQVKDFCYLYATLTPAAVVLANFAMWVVSFRAKEKHLSGGGVCPDWDGCGCNACPTFRCPDLSGPPASTNTQRSPPL